MIRAQSMILHVVGLLGGIMVINSVYASPDGLDQLLPETINGWQTRAPDSIHTSDTLFELINGGAEVYRSLNVRRVLDRTYVKADAADIIVDVFDMGSSNDAYGAFHHDTREDLDQNIGQESENQGSSLFFWKDRYFISVIALDETSKIKKTVLALGQKIASKIPQPGSKPDIVKLLPNKDLQEQHLYFFHDQESLERRYLIGEGNPLHLSKTTDGLLARYRESAGDPPNPEQGHAVFLIIAYPAPSTVAAAQRDFSAVYLNKAKPGTVVQLSNKLWVGSRTKGAHLFAVLEASDRSTAEDLLDSAALQ